MRKEKIIMLSSLIPGKSPCNKFLKKIVTQVIVTKGGSYVWDIGQIQLRYYITRRGYACTMSEQAINTGKKVFK